MSAKTGNAPTSGARYEAELPVGKHPLQLYSIGTPNGKKATIMLEELGLAYDAWGVNIMTGENFSSGFEAISPNEKIPALVDREGPDGEEFSVFESGAILLYLVENKAPDSPLMPKDPAGRSKVMQWLMWQMGSAPYFGQYNHFAVFAKEKIPYAIDRYTMETKRLLDVFDKELAREEYIAGDTYSVADIAAFPWINSMVSRETVAEDLAISGYKNIERWWKLVGERPAVIRGLTVNGFTEETKNYSTEGNK